MNNSEKTYTYLPIDTGNTQIFLVGYLSLLFRLLVEMSSIINFDSWVYNAMTLVFVASMMYIIMNQSMKTGFLIKLSIAFLIIIVSYLKMQYFFIVISFLGIIACANVDFIKVLRYSYRIKAFWLALHIFIYIVTYICTPENIDYSYRNGEMRHYFFLSHANTFSMLLVWTILEFMYVNRKRVTLLQMAVLWVCNVILNMFCDSKTSMITSTIIIFLMILYKSPIELPFRWVHTAAKYGFGVMSILSCLIIVFYRSYNSVMMSVFSMLDQIFTGRLLFGAFAYDTEGWTLLGKTAEFSHTVYWEGHWFDSLIMDNAYLYCFLYLGTIYLIVISIGFFLAEKYMDDMECIFVIAYILYAITENYVVNIVFCFPLMFISYAVYHHRFAGQVKQREVKK